MATSNWDSIDPWSQSQLQDLNLMTTSGRQKSIFIPKRRWRAVHEPIVKPQLSLTSKKTIPISVNLLQAAKMLNNTLSRSQALETNFFHHRKAFNPRRRKTSFDCERSVLEAPSLEDSRIDFNGTKSAKIANTESSSAQLESVRSFRLRSVGTSSPVTPSFDAENKVNNMITDLWVRSKANKKRLIMILKNARSIKSGILVCDPALVTRRLRTVE